MVLYDRLKQRQSFPLWDGGENKLNTLIYISLPEHE